MYKIDNITKETWVLCHNGINVFHIVNLQVGNKLETGQEFVEQFDIKEGLEARVNTLNPQWLINYKKTLENK